MRVSCYHTAMGVSAKELKMWEQSEPERLDARADDWERAAKQPGANLNWLALMACQARQAAANLRAMRSARMRTKANCE